MGVIPKAHLSTDPFPEYARMRKRGAVHRSERGGMWMVCGHAEVELVLRDPRTFSSEIGSGAMGIGNSMIMKDPPEHTRLRSIVSKAFTPRTIADLEPRIREIAVELLDGIVPDQPFDVVDTLAIPLPITVIAEMLGVDAADRSDFKRWSNAITGVVPMGQAKLHAEFGEYFGRVLDERKREPRDDLISRLVVANDGEVLSTDEMLSFVMLLLVAGNETTTNLIGLATFYLSLYPEQRDELVGDPSLIPGAVEEILRFDGPVHMVPPRIVRGDVNVGGVDLRAGDWLMPVLAAANRDENRFADPDAFDIHRPDASSHVSFGAGIHFCLGAPLSRLEGRVVLEELLVRAPRFRLAQPDEPVPVASSNILRTITSLPIVA